MTEAIIAKAECEGFAVEVRVSPRWVGMTPEAVKAEIERGFWVITPDSIGLYPATLPFQGTVIEEATHVRL